MTEYWKSIDKKFCDSVEFHENGRRHKENVQNRLRDIHKKTKQEDKKNRKMGNQLKRIEQAALSAFAKDVEENPDLPTQLKDTTAEAPVEKEEIKILHRSESQKKADHLATKKFLDKQKQQYNSRGGWESHDSKNILDLELPKQKVVAVKPKFDLRSLEGKRKKETFKEKTTATASSSSGSFVPIKTEEVAFKKRKFNQSLRRRGDDD